MLRAAASLACVLAIAGCGASEPRSAAPSKADLAKALQGSPPPLAALHRQANQLLNGGEGAFKARLASLRGHPVVVNSWGSWCAPCRGEFPIFQRVVLDIGNRVAFIGLDAQDNDGNARKFLGQFPVTYPSYKDPDGKISSKRRAGGYFPTTIFFNRAGKLVYAHPGPYGKIADLVADINRYAS